MKRIPALLLLLLISASAGRLAAAESEEGFKTIFDGKTMNGWRLANENQQAWKVEDGALVANGPRCHIYYVGEDQPFKNFELKVDVMTEPNSNGGIYFHTRYQEPGWPKYGFESQVNVSHGDWIKSGSLWGVVNVGLTTAKDNQWWTQHIIVKDNKVTVMIDGSLPMETPRSPASKI